MSTSKPVPNLAAVLPSPKARFTITERHISKPGPAEVLVRNYAIAANPVDWKIQDYSFAVKTYPTVLGSDGCGVIHSVGEGSKFKVGERVMGFGGVIYNDNADHGSWQTYTVLQDMAVVKIPDFMSYEQGSVFPMATATAAVALFSCLSIPRPLSTNPAPQKSSILIWGAASSIGVMTLQLAKALGFTILAAASPTHHEYLKSLGATEVFDYRSQDIVSQIVEAAKASGYPIKYGFDAIGEGTTSLQSASILLASGGVGSKLCLALPWPEKEPKPEGLELSETAAYGAFTKYREMGEWFFGEYLGGLLKEKKVVAAPRVEVVEGGVEGAQEALDRVKKGVSGRKVVVKLV